MIAFEVPKDRFEQVELRLFGYCFHTCCPVLYSIGEDGDVRAIPEHPENIRVKAACWGCRDARREHDWGDV